MTKLQDKILEQLEKEAKEWIKKEYSRRQELVRKEIEKQVTAAQEHDGRHAADVVRSYHERAMGYAMSELRHQVEFEADQWIIEEMEKRLKAQEKKGAGRGAQGAEKKPKAGAKTGTKPKSSTKTKTEK